MCGALPTTLYKVLPAQYARQLLSVGEMMWSTLTCCQHVLDPTRGDPFEGSLRYFPSEGLTVTRSARNGRPDHAQFTLAAQQLIQAPIKRMARSRRQVCRRDPITVVVRACVSPSTCAELVHD